MEILGFVAGAITLISFFFSKIFVVRMINIVGAALFLAYGVLTGAWSIMAFNVALIIIHVFYLVSHYIKRRGF